MFIEQFRYSADNLGYLVYSRTQGVAVDGGAVEAMTAFAENRGFQIKYVVNTHSHHDHTLGNAALLRKTGAQFIDCTRITSDETIPLDREILEVFHTPGHTQDSVTFKADDFLITGDTLFNGTVGNCFTNDFNAFFSALKRLTSLPKETRIYGGHDYVMESMKIAKAIEPDNPCIDEYIRGYNPKRIVSTLEDELKANLYLRFNAPAMVQKLEAKHMPAKTEFERFHSIMEMY
jgi:hydroxyacylglutathione hydrolase